MKKTPLTMPSFASISCCALLNIKKFQGLIFTLLIICSSGSTRGQFSNYQPFPNDSAQWSVLIIYFNWPRSEYYTEHYKLRGDTIVGGHTYGKVYRSRTEDYAPGNYDTLHLFLRQDTAARKIMVKYPDLNVFPDTSEFVLYDFSKGVNQKIVLRYLNDSNHSYLNHIAKGKAIINDTVLITDTTSRVINTNDGFRTHYYRTERDYSCKSFSPMPYYKIELIEGIGTDLSPFINEHSSCEMNENGVYLQRRLWCFKVKGIEVIRNFNTCHVPYTVHYVGTENLSSEKSPRIYPNPVEAYLTVEPFPGTSTHLQILNGQGQVVYTAETKEKLEIPRNKIKAEGLVYVRLSSSSGEQRSYMILLK